MCAEWGGGHHQHVRRSALFDQSFALQHAEAMLLVDDHQAEPPKLNRIFDQRVGADDKLRVAALRSAAIESSLSARLRPLTITRLCSPRAQRCGARKDNAATARISVGAISAT